MSFPENTPGYHDDSTDNAHIYRVIEVSELARMAINHMTDLKDLLRVQRVCRLLNVHVRAIKKDIYRSPDPGMEILRVSNKDTAFSPFVYHAFLDAANNPRIAAINKPNRYAFFFLRASFAQFSLVNNFEGGRTFSQPMTTFLRSPMQQLALPAQPLGISWEDASKHAWCNVYISMLPVSTVHIYTSNSVGSDRRDFHFYNAATTFTVDNKHRLTTLREESGVTIGDVLEGVRNYARKTGSWILTPLMILFGEQEVSEEERVAYHKVVARFFGREYDNFP